MVAREVVTQLEGLSPYLFLGSLCQGISLDCKYKEQGCLKTLPTVILTGMGHKVVRIWAGHMMTSLEMAGVLVSVLKVGLHSEQEPPLLLHDNIKVTNRPDWEELLDAATSAPAWPAVLRGSAGPDRVTPLKVEVMRKEEEELAMMKGAKLGEEGEKKVREALEGLTRDLVAMEQRLNELDSGSGDGDCGSTLAAGAKAIQVLRLIICVAVL